LKKNESILRLWRTTSRGSYLMRLAKRPKFALTSIMCKITSRSV